MSKLLFWGSIQVFAGISKEYNEQIDDQIWIIRDSETLTTMLKNALLKATRGDLQTLVPFTLKQIDFSYYNSNDCTYNVKCLVEVDKNIYDNNSGHYQDLVDFYLTGIPSFEHQVEENLLPDNMHSEFSIKL